jgi:hypothetical protein
MYDIIEKGKRRGAFFIGVTTLARLEKISLRQHPNPYANKS